MRNSGPDAKMQAVPSRALRSARALWPLVVVSGLIAPLATADESARATARNETTSIWNAVFTKTQAQRGKAAYTGPCSQCHGHKLDGAPDDPDMFSTPPLAGPKFLRDWDGRSLAALYEYTRMTMPENNPSYLSDQEFVDIVAYMLLASGVPAGGEDLPADAQSLSHVLIARRP